MDFDLVIRGGTVVTAGDVQRCDIGIRGERVAALGENLPAGTAEIDASGLLVLPGGVDTHCHLDQPTTGPARLADDFASGTRSAACGGTTTIVPFACQVKGQSLRLAIEDYHRRAEGKAVVDYAFHVIITDPTDQVLGQELPALIREGYTSFKIYMTYDDLKLNDRQILDVLDLARREDAMVMVHAENADCIAWLTERLERDGHTAPRDHARSRPMLVEREATHRAISLAELVDVPILIVHVSGAEAVEQIHRAQGRGLRIHAETCPQYLVLSEENLEGDWHEAAKYVCSPPPRGKANQKVIWDALRNGTLQVLSSDHAPYTMAGATGKLAHGAGAPFRKIPNGVPGIETRLPLVFSEGVGQGRLTLEQFVAITATNPARLYGLYPRKGTIAIGADADLVLWDPSLAVTITNAMLHHAADYTPYEGMVVTGWPITTLSRGEVIQSGGRLSAEAGRGRFLPCSAPLR